MMRAAFAGHLPDVLFSVCCVALLGMGASRYWPVAPPAHAAREHVLRERSVDPFHLSAEGGARPMLYVFISPSCQPCRDSLPFYRRLANESRNGVRDLVFVGMELEPQLTSYLREAGITDVRVASVARPAGVPGTPSIVAVDTAGRVVESWAGRLNQTQEGRVLSLLVSAQGPGAAAPRAVDQLLARAKAHLDGPRRIDSVASLELIGTETEDRDTNARTQPYGFTLRPPDSLDWRAGPILHTLNAGAYSRRIIDTERYGGPMVDRILADAKFTAIASSGMHFHLLRLAAAFLARPVDGAVLEDAGVRDFGRLKGPAIAFVNRATQLRVQIVVDRVTAEPLGVVTAARVETGDKATMESTWISIPSDYRLVSGVRVPHRIDEWIDDRHSRIVITEVVVK
jgi:hypothetical protein